MKYSKTALYIRSGGEETYVLPKMGLAFTLEELQGYVGGNIEIVRTTNDREVMVINEEGKLKGLPVNKKATYLYPYADTDQIVGDVLIVNKYLIK